LHMPEPGAARRGPPDDLLPLLDQELSRLPDHYRAVIVLCDLEGRTRKEAARELGLAEGTVASRLARARALLARRLVKHGPVLTGGSLAALLSERAPACVPAPVMSSMLRAASLVAAGRAGLISAKVAALTEGVVKAMLLSKLRTAALALVVVVAGAGAGGALFKSQAAQPPTEGAPSAPAPGTTPPAFPSILPADGSNPAVPTPTPEQLRSRYLQLQEELARHMTAVQVRQRVEELEKEVAAAREREQRSLREKKAADELEKIRAMLSNLASTYPETEAGAKARRAFEVTAPSLGSTPMVPGLFSAVPTPTIPRSGS
jgi:hypothetical protein